MIISDCRNSNLYVSELDSGEVFEYDGHFYLMAKLTEGNKMITAVNLETGEIIRLDGRTRVGFVEHAKVVLGD